MNVVCLFYLFIFFFFNEFFDKHDVAHHKAEGLHGIHVLKQHFVPI